MELWDLLDKDGNKIGKTHQRGEKMPEGTYHLGVDVWIMNDKKELLIQKRSMLKNVYPGYWAMTGGSVLAGETSREAAQRETLEELGVELDVSNLKLINQFQTNTAFVDTYIVKQNVKIEQIKMQAEEVDEVKWATQEEIDKLYAENKFVQNRWDNVKNVISKF